MGFVPVPRSELTPLVNVVGVVPDSGIPDDGERVDYERERDGPLAGAVLAVGIAFILRGRSDGASGAGAAQGDLYTEVESFEP